MLLISHGFGRLQIGIFGTRRSGVLLLGALEACNDKMFAMRYDYHLQHVSCACRYVPPSAVLPPAPSALKLWIDTPETPKAKALARHKANSYEAWFCKKWHDLHYVLCSSLSLHSAQAYE